jgi:hypothetical protein
MDYPNKIYVSEYNGENGMFGNVHFVIVVAASSLEVAKSHVKEKIGIDIEPTWLMNGVHPTIYVSNGSVSQEIQAKILFNGNAHYRY